MPTLSKTTVYNTLKVLVENGAALQLTIDEKNTRYDGNTHPHAHFICLGCGKVHDVEGVDLAAVTKTNHNGLQITETQVYYKGYCEECQKMMNR
jgi:Fur family ferric uptake transcriptional regulator/Fur family peroxide stress response transcriptional regulator